MMAPTGHAAVTSRQDDDDDLLRLIPSSVEHMQHGHLFSDHDDESTLCGGTAKSSNLQLYSNDERPAAKHEQILQMQTMISRAFSTSMPKKVEETPKSFQELAELGLALTSSSLDGNLELKKSPFATGGGTFGLPVMPTSSSASSSLSSSPAPSSPAVPSLIQLPKVGSTSISPFGGGLLDFGMAGATFSTSSTVPSASSNAIASTNTSCAITNTSKGITADRFYADILDSMLDQSKSVEEAYQRNEAYERGVSWRELLNKNMDLHPLAATTTAFARDAGKVVTTIVPRRHNLPILLEAARVWRRAVEETIDCRLDREGDDRLYSDWEDRSEYDNDGGKYKLAQHIIPPVDRRLLARQGGRIVQRYLALHDVFSSSSGNNDEDDIKVSEEGTTTFDIYVASTSTAHAI